MSSKRTGAVSLEKQREARNGLVDKPSGTPEQQQELIERAEANIVEARYTIAKLLENNKTKAAEKMKVMMAQSEYGFRVCHCAG
jgi:cellobiose-specific phosphotransferase system component IIA